MVAPNNSILLNAAMGGFFAGMVKGRYLTAKNTGTPPAIGTPDPSYAEIVFQALSVGEELDSLIPPDVTGAAQPSGSLLPANQALGTSTQFITVAASGGNQGKAIVPVTGSTGSGSATGSEIAFGEITKDLMMKALVLGIIEGRGYGFPTLLVPPQVAAVMADVVAAYGTGANGLFASPLTQPTPGASGATYNNQLLAYAAYAGGLAGMLAGNPSLLSASSSVDSAGASNTSAALTRLALTVDALIPNDATISQASANGEALPSGSGQLTGSSVQSQLGKCMLLFSITFAVMYKRNVQGVAAQMSSPSVPASWAAWAIEEANVIGAVYGATESNIQTGTQTSLNPALWNMAYVAFVCGNLTGRPITVTSTSDPAYVAIANAAVAFANEVDATVGASDTSGSPVPVGSTGITTVGEGGNTTSTPSSSEIMLSVLAKSNILWAICRGVQHGRPLLNNSLDTTASTYANISQSIVALYLDAISEISVP